MRRHPAHSGRTFISARLTSTMPAGGTGRDFGANAPALTGARLYAWGGRVADRCVQ